METTTIIGYVALVAAIFFGITFGEGQLNFDLIMNFVSLPSILITVGGTCFALLASIPFKYFKKMPKHFKMVFTKDRKDPYEYVEIITELSKEARKKGLLALEDKAYTFEDEFLRESVLLIVDAIEPDKLKMWFDQKLDLIARRNEEELKIYDQGAAFGPAFGMLGTLIGLINMLKSMNLENGAEFLGESMSVALITTFYGSVLANAFFLPMANKLETVQQHEMLIKELIAEGVISIKEGENPRYIQEKLLNYIEQRKEKEETEELVENI
ncbi:MAG: motility protein A [Clostridiales bacterium]|nr:motility protein A [Clostridiales bacterium]